RPGQIVLRTLAQLANAGFDALDDDVADAAGVDTAMRYGANHPQGPIEWAGRFGTARLAAVLATIAAATGDPIYAPSPSIAVPEPA
ncbi:3-hydroxyacyl-CoA dehydrogenase family protein, partial [Rhizorhabdus wittichii]